MSIFSNYDPARVVIVFRGLQLVGPMDGTFVSVERTEDAFSMQVGAAGDVTRVRSRDKTGSVTITLQAASPSNEDLSAVAAEDENFGTGYGALMIKDLNGTTLISAEKAWIKKLPNVEFGDEASGREWVLDCAELKMAIGSAVIV